MSGIAWNLFATAVFILLNGYFVAAELALVKVRPGRISTLAREGDRSARWLVQLLGRLDLFLSACQRGITLASLIHGRLAEPAVAKLLIAGAEAVDLPADPKIVHGAALARQPVFVPEIQKISHLIHALQEAGSGCAVAVDEYGAAAGMVFLEDAVEEIVGPIRDEIAAYTACASNRRRLERLARSIQWRFP